MQFIGSFIVQFLDPFNRRAETPSPLGVKYFTMRLILSFSMFN